MYYRSFFGFVFFAFILQKQQHKTMVEKHENTKKQNKPKAALVTTVDKKMQNKTSIVGSSTNNELSNSIHDVSPKPNTRVPTTTNELYLSLSLFFLLFFCFGIAKNTHKKKK